MFVDFKEKFLLMRVIIDCMEVWCEMLSSLFLNFEFFSVYKNYVILKGFVGIVLSGGIIFVS